MRRAPRSAQHDAEQLIAQFMGVIDRMRLALRSPGMARATTIVFLSNLAMQGLSLASVPLLTRIYSPESYGLFAAFVVAAGYLYQLAVLRYDAAIDLASNDREAIAVMHLSLIGIAFFAALAAIAGVAYSREAAALLQHPESQSIVWLIAAALLLNGTGNILNAWLVRQRDFLAPNLIRLALGVFDIAAKVALGLLGMTVFGQVFGSLATGFLTVIAVALLVRARRWPVFAPARWSEIKAAARKHRSLPLFAFPASIAELTAFSLPPIAIGLVFGPQAAGIYFVADRLVQAPTVAISSAVRPVFKIYAAAEHNAGGDLKQTVGKTLAVTTPIALAFLLSVVFGLPIIFPILFDARWESALLLCQILAVSRAMDIAVNAVTPVLMIHNRNRSNFFIQVYLLTGAIAAFWIADQTNDLILGITVYTAAFATKSLIEIAIILHLVYGGAAPKRIDAPTGATKAPRPSLGEPS